MKEFLIRNLCDGPRDYPLSNGESIYLGSRGRSTGITQVKGDLISEALRLAEHKGLVIIEEIETKTESKSKAKSGEGAGE